jgi:class 3 adenylate cyclase/tetratricopeptide (TPR) repeat protein
MVLRFDRMVCTSCGTENRAGAKFCANCGHSLALTCPSCGTPYQADDAFCVECGHALQAPAVAAAPDRAAPAAERRLVTVLFADLVGFTSLSEGRDSEAVRELQSRYFETCSRVIGLYRGTVEKFIGDAVMAVWGTPVAREDDAERAVRAALDLVDVVAALEGELRVRGAVLTGEAAVTVGAQGQGMVAGDLVNTASRLQSLAGPGAVLVGERTRAATEAAIAYEEAGAQELRGKSEPVAVWRALRVTASRGGVGKAAGLEAPFAGRERELRLVKDLFHATADERRARLLSVVGLAGIGKSRLSWEFEKYLDGVVDNVWWHRGRCLPYGEGVSYWALAEMVRMRARIAETDDPAAGLAKLRDALEPLVVDADERAWIEPRLAHLLGLGEHAAADRQDLFSAWRRLFERLAEQSPCILVFDDLQWADSALLDFVEYLLDWSRNHPLFVITLARPELAERRPDWGAGKGNAHSLFLEPLADEAMDALLGGLVPGLPAELRERIRDRADGVPLYAVETVRTLVDRGLVERVGDEYRPAGPIEALEVPDSLHALIAARLDALEPDERRLVADASVLGKTFTREALGAVSGYGEAELDSVLAALVRKELLAVQADPRSPQRGQYGFLQSLVQTVAQATLSRRERKARHLAAATYFEAAWGSDEDEIVEVVAAHLLDAYRAEPDAEDAAEIKEMARGRLVGAGERAASLAAAAEAQRYFEQAAELAEERPVEAELRERAGAMAQSAARADDALQHLEQSIALFEAEGESHAAARVAARLGRVLEMQGDTQAALERMEQSFAVLARDEPDEGVATLAAELARTHFFRGDLERALERVEFALEVAEALWLPELLSEALNTKHLVLGQGHGRQEEAEGLLRQALRIALENDAMAAYLRASFNLSHATAGRDRVAEAIAIDLEGVALARKRGDRVFELFFLMHLTGHHLQLGDWAETLACAAEVPADEPDVPRLARIAAVAAAMVHAERGDVAAARAARDAVGRDLDAANVQARAGYDVARSLVLLAEDSPAEALDAADATFGLRDRLGPTHPLVKLAFPYACRASLALGDLDRLSGLVAEVEALPRGQTSPFLAAQAGLFRAHLEAQRGDPQRADPKFRTAVASLRELSFTFWLAAALLAYAEWLAGDGRGDEAEPLLAEARETFERLEARPWLERVDAVQSGAQVPA